MTTFSREMTTFSREMTIFPWDFLGPLKDRGSIGLVMQYFPIKTNANDMNHHVKGVQKKGMSKAGDYFNLLPDYPSFGYSLVCSIAV